MVPAASRASCRARRLGALAVLVPLVPLGLAGCGHASAAAAKVGARAIARADLAAEVEAIQHTTAPTAAGSASTAAGDSTAAGPGSTATGPRTTVATAAASPDDQ